MLQYTENWSVYQKCTKKQRTSLCSTFMKNGIIKAKMNIWKSLWGQITNPAKTKTKKKKEKNNNNNKHTFTEPRCEKMCFIRVFVPSFLWHRFSIHMLTNSRRYFFSAFPILLPFFFCVCVSVSVFFDFIFFSLDFSTKRAIFTTARNTHKRARNNIKLANILEILLEKKENWLATLHE